MSKKVKFDWYRLLVDDSKVSRQPKLLRRFWAFYWSHRLTKQRAAYCVLKSYYSTTPLSNYLKQALYLRRASEVVKVDWLNTDLLESLQ